MIDHHSCDLWGVHLPDDTAFFMGRRVVLECTAICGDEIWATSFSKGVPTMKLRCEFPSWIMAYFDVGRRFTVTDFKIIQNQNFQSICPKSGLLLPVLHPISGHKVVAEAFAGIGGWSHGASFCGTRASILIEKDEITAHACGRSHGLRVLSLDEALSLASFMQLPDAFVLCADVIDFKVHVICGLLGVTAWLASPPCQPWSKAGWQKGFETVDGGIFASFIYATALSEPVCLNLENVPGLPDHPHFPVLLQILSEAGWSIVSSSVDQIYPLLPIMRARWLATCVSNKIHIDPKNAKIANDIQFPDMVPGFGFDNSPCKFGCIIKNPQEWELLQSVPDKQAIEAMSKPEFLPLKFRVKNYHRMDPKDVFHLRITNGNRPLPNAMASQGSQHLLPPDLLHEKGLHAYLLNDGLNLRFISPMEIGTAMGFPSSMILPSDFSTAWKIVGNALTVPHAAIQCLRAHYVLGSVSMFQHGIKGPLELCDRVMKERFSINNFTVTVTDGWMSLVPNIIKVQLPPSIPDTIAVSDDDDDNCNEVVLNDPYFVSIDEPPSKRPCISPTWHAYPDEPSVIPELQRADFPNCADWTVGVKHLTSGVSFDCIRDPDPSDEGLCVKLMHSQGSWACSKQVCFQPGISEAIRTFLPHAVQEHFDLIWLNGHLVTFGTVPEGCSFMNICFKPYCFLRIVQAPWLSKDLPIEVDVAWTFQDLIAFVACEASVFPSSVCIKACEQTMHNDSFVLADEGVCFQAELIQINVNEQSPSQVRPVQPIANLQCDQHDASVPHQVGIRFTTRHPKWGSVRSVSIATTACVKDLILDLLPGFENHAPQLFIDEILIDPTTKVDDLPSGYIEVVFNGERPWPVVLVVKTSPSSLSGYPGEFCVKDVKGPFDARPKSLKIPLDWTLLHLVASFLDHYDSHFTLLVLQDGKSVDPRTFVQQAGTSTIEIRVCALPGGGKNDQLTKKLADTLVKRGVPEVDKTSRASLILSKLPHSEVEAILSKNEFDAWSELKKKANEHKVRMITANELKQFQGKLRKDKAAAKPSSSKSHGKKPSKTNAPDVDPNHVTIDLSHFVCDNKTPNSIKVAQRGPDSKGIAIASPTEAKKLLPVTNLSADGLALLVLTDRLFEGKPPFTMPAIDSQGNPMLASGVLLNFGDVEIRYLPSLPAASLTEVPTATLEVMIQKKLVPKWSVQNPLNYLGLQLPEIRSEKVIQSWNFRAYNLERERVKHDVADYIHGFVKIPEDLLLSILPRSGLAGVFLQVKGLDRKLDPRFGVVTMHGSSLDDVLKLAKNTKDVLGVVQLGHQQVFGLRAKREHLAAVRRCVLPQGIAIQEGDIPPGSTWWLLKNLKASTTCADLTLALRSLGWEASAIRPGGRYSWIVCSTDEPPATHLCLNEDYVAVVPMKSKGQETPKTTGSFARVKQADFSMCPEDSDTTTVATRISTLSSDLEDKLTNMINEKIQACDAKFDWLNNSFESLKHGVEATSHQTQMELDLVKEQQSTIQAQLGSVETSIASSSNALMSQMQGLFQQMQNSLNARLDSFDGDVNKRRKES